MRKITNNAVNAFMQAKSFSEGNTTVRVLPNVTILSLFGNDIAYRYNDPEKTLSINSCGYKTATTKERLNAIEGVNIQPKAGKWYLNGVEWDGNLIDVNRAQK